MTNTKFRKRALLSSVAMLLVALVALGSATFAWYQANMSVSAAGMSFTTDAASGLEIIAASQVTANAVSVDSTALGTKDYGSQAVFTTDHTKSLQPASFDPAKQNTDTPPKTIGAFYTTTGTDAGTGTIKDGATVSTSTDYVEEYVYFKIAQAGTTTGGTVKLSSVGISVPTANGAPKTMSSAVRVVVYNSDLEPVAEFKPGSTDSAAQKLIATGTYTTATAANFIGTKTVTGAGSIPTADQPTICSVTKSKLDSQCCLVRVYLDGFDENVISNNATVVGGIDTSETADAADILKGITLGFTMTDPTSN